MFMWRNNEVLILFFIGMAAGMFMGWMIHEMQVAVEEQCKRNVNG
jgi:hypothetical protein